MLHLALVLLLAPFAAAPDDDEGWRALFDGSPLDRDAWVQVGGGRFVQEDGVLKTEPDSAGLGVLVYAKEKLGDCQIRVVYKSDRPRDNAGVHVRIGDDWDRLKAPSDPDKETGAWYAVHHGYEVQICDTGNPYSRTGAVYSLAPSAELPDKPAGEWKTMIITLDGDRILVDIDGRRVTEFDPDSKDLPERKQWYEPKREPRRPRAGYLGLQCHDPGDVVYFKEVSVRPLPDPKR